MIAPLPIGVFDSGIGGLSILRALRAELPDEHFVYLADSGFAPYGERDKAFVRARTEAIAAYLRRHHAIKALVIACNTATAAAVHTVRAHNPDLIVVGVEPALKPALAASHTGRIGVMATRGTVESAKFQTLLANLQANAADSKAQFIVQACDGLASAIEQAAWSGDPQNATKIRALCSEYTGAMGKFGSQTGDIDTLVLGCTHYAFASPVLADLLGPQVQLLDNGQAVARHTRRLLAVAGLLQRVQPTQQVQQVPADTVAPGLLVPGSVPGAVPEPVTWLSTGDPTPLQTAAQRWLGLQAKALPTSVPFEHDAHEKHDVNIGHQPP